MKDYAPESERKLGQNEKAEKQMKERGAAVSSGDNAKLERQKMPNLRKNDYVKNEYAGK
jgi:hypothetical protein